MNQRTFFEKLGVKNPMQVYLYLCIIHVVSIVTQWNVRVYAAVSVLHTNN